MTKEQEMIAGIIPDFIAAQRYERENIAIPNVRRFLEFELILKMLEDIAKDNEDWEFVEIKRSGSSGFLSNGSIIITGIDFSLGYEEMRVLSLISKYASSFEVFPNCGGDKITVVIGFDGMMDIIKK